MKTFHSRRLSRSAIVLTAAALGLLVAVAGCRDDQNGDSNDTGSPTDVAPDGTDSTDTATDSGEDGETTGQSLQLPGLSAPVTVRYDDLGVLHIECETVEDCVAAQGYFHADDRFFEMDLVRRQTRGKLSTLIGLNLGADRDTRFRHLMSTRQGEPLAEAYVQEMDEQTRQMLEAYGKGVNAWLEDMRNDENGATLTEEYEFGLLSKEIPDWQVEDSVALYLQLAFQLSLTSKGDLFRGDMVDALGAEVAKDLFTVKPGPVSNIMDVEMAASHTPGDAGGELDALREVERRLEPAGRAIDSARETIDAASPLLFGEPSPRDGSNNWVVSGDQTDSGNALLANDPHLSINNPAIWYFVELHVNGDSEDLHVAGASIPSVPGVVVGHNEDVAWGVTTARLDLADAYVETLNEDGTAVIRNGQEVSLIEKTVTLEGKGDQTRETTLEWVPEHGPLVSKDPSNNRGVSVKWVAHDPGPDFNFLLPLMRSESVQDAVDAMEPVETISQSWVFADSSGSIGWYPKGAIPSRPWASPQTPNWLPLPGDGSAEWQGEVSKENSPKLVDPPKGYIATANNDFDGSYTDGDPTNDGHPVWQSPPAPGNRHARISELLEQDLGSHTVETMDAVQSDTYSIQGATLAPRIVDAAENAASLSDGAQEVVEALKAWNYTCPTGLDGTDPEEAAASSDGDEVTDAFGCAAFHVSMPYVTDAIFGDELQPADFDARESWWGLQVALWYVLENPSELARGADYFDDTTTEGTTETKSEVIASALDEAAGRLESLFDSSDRSDWLWGRIHTVSLRSLFSGQGITQWDEGPWANDGGLSTVDVANPTGEDFSHTRGPSLRLVVELGEEGVEGQFQLPGGQDHHRDSDYYISLMDGWLRNESQNLHFAPSDVKEAAVETWVVEPAN